MTDFTTFPIPAKKLSELPVVTELDGTEYLVGVKGGVTSRFPVSLFVTPPSSDFEVGTQFSNSWGGAPTAVSGTGWGVTGGSTTVSAFTGTISPGTLDAFDGIGVGYVNDGDTSDLYFLLFLNGADGSETYAVSGDGITGTLNTADATFTSTNYGDAFVWAVGTGSAPAPWNGENTFNISIVAV